jgi:Flp pilus assembly protein TadD
MSDDPIDAAAGDETPDTDDSLTPEEAITKYTADIETDPQDAVAYFNRGSAHYNNQDLEAAIDDYREAIRLAPDFAAAYAQRGYALFGTGSLSAALDDFRQVAKLLPDDPVALNNVGYLYMVMRRASRAEAAWARATALPDAPAYALAGHAVALKQLRKNRPAAEQYAKAVAVDPRWRDDLTAVAEEYNWTEGMVALAEQIVAELADES